MNLKILHYNNGHDITIEEYVMSRGKAAIIYNGETFGDRLARFRQTAGLSQRDLAAEVGISQRMVVYYEKECERIPINLLPELARVLGISADQLLGIEKVKDNGKKRDNRLWRRFSQVEKLPTTQRKQIVQILDAFLEREKLKKGVG